MKPVQDIVDFQEHQKVYLKIVALWACVAFLVSVVLHAVASTVLELAKLPYESAIVLIAVAVAVSLIIVAVGIYKRLTR